MGRTRLLAALAVASLGTRAPAQTAMPSPEATVAATHPMLVAGKLTGHVIRARTAECKMVLTLDSGQTYMLDLGKSAVAMNTELLIGDGDDVIALDYQGDGAREGARAAEAAIGSMNARCN
jgi:hypothetical protein